MLKEFENTERSLKESDKNLEWGRKWSISFSSFLESSERLGKGSAILPSLQHLKRQAAKSQLKRPYPCNDTKTAWEVFHDTTTFHGIICPFSSVVFVLEKATAQSWKK